MSFYECPSSQVCPCRLPCQAISSDSTNILVRWVRIESAPTWHLLGKSWHTLYRSMLSLLLVGTFKQQHWSFDLPVSRRLLSSQLKYSSCTNYQPVFADTLFTLLLSAVHSSLDLFASSITRTALNKWSCKWSSRQQRYSQWVHCLVGTFSHNCSLPVALVHSSSPHLLSCRSELQRLALLPRPTHPSLVD